jgi:hypothetical protein
MTLQEEAYVKNVTGKNLWNAIRKADRLDRSDLFHALYMRAKELNTQLRTTWAEAVQKFQSMDFPDWRVTESKNQQILVNGYPCEIFQEVDDTCQIKARYMSLMHPQTNSCVIKSFISNREVQFK